MNNYIKKGTVIAVMVLLFSCLTSTALTITAEAAATISYSKAKSIAKKKVPNARLAELDTDYENGHKVYEATLYKNNTEYNVEILASNGKIVTYEWEKDSTSHSIQHKKNIGKTKAKKVALKKIKGGKITSTKLTRDDGISYYKIKMTKGSKTCFLEVDAKTGKLLQYKWKKYSLVKAPKANYIGTEKAQKIALAKVPGASIVKVEFDMDDGVPVYEVELRKGYTEYDIVIHAVSGTILEYEVD